MADEPPFVMTAGFSDGATLVAITGDLDLTTVSALAAMLNLALDRRPGRLVLDLSGVPYLDCASSRVIARTAQALPGQQCVIRNPVPMVRRLLELTDLAPLIEDGRPSPSPAADRVAADRPEPGTSADARHGCASR